MMRYIFLFALAMSMAFSSCQQHDTEIHDDLHSMGVPMEKQTDCPPEIRRFDLAYNEVFGAENQLYEVELVTDPFQVAGCMCRVIAYELHVTHPSAYNWTLYMQNGANVTHAKVQSPNGDTLIVSDLDQLMEYFGDSNSAVMLAEFFKDLTVQSADLVRATGLCIIENYDGFNPNIPQFSLQPIYDSIPATPPATGFVHVAYIPTGMTQAL